MNRSVLSLFAIAAHLSTVLPALAQKPTVEQALQLKPMQPDVQFDRPAADTIDQCRIDPSGKGFAHFTTPRQCAVRNLLQ